MILRLPIGALQANAYLLFDREGGEAAIVDPGGDPVPLFREIERRRLTVRYVLNTHAHFDHIAANAIVKQRYPQALLMLHRADFPLLAEGGGAAWFDLMYVPSPPADHALEDGERLRVGALVVEALHTPGHTPGSLCFYLPEEGMLLSGDTLFRGAVGRTDLPGGDEVQLRASLRRLSHLPPETVVYPGHGGTTTIAREIRRGWLARLP